MRGTTLLGGRRRRCQLLPDGSHSLPKTLRGRCFEPQASSIAMFQQLSSGKLRCAALHKEKRAQSDAIQQRLLSTMCYRSRRRRGTTQVGAGDQCPAAVSIIRQ